MEEELEQPCCISLENLCGYLDSGEYDRGFERKFICGLRYALAKVSVGMLEPDFVIMDEFQRFRNLIADDGSETYLLAKRFLDGGTRVLLLSATREKLTVEAKYSMKTKLFAVPALSGGNVIVRTGANELVCLEAEP